MQSLCVQGKCLWGCMAMRHARQVSSQAKRARIGASPAGQTQRSASTLSSNDHGTLKWYPEPPSVCSDAQKDMSTCASLFFLPWSEARISVVAAGQC
eukprot:1146135-Pelagomonas_calceolata.AAC.27